MITAVVFDMDGILFDTERLCRDCWIAPSKEYEIPNMEEVYALCIGVNVQATRQIVYDNYGKDFPFEEYDRRASAMYNEYIAEHGVPVKEGVRETLEALAKAGAKIAVASSTRQTVTSAMLRFKVLFCISTWTATVAAPSSISFVTA